MNPVIDSIIVLLRYLLYYSVRFDSMRFHVIAGFSFPERKIRSYYDLLDRYLTETPTADVAVIFVVVVANRCVSVA